MDYENSKVINIIRFVSFDFPMGVLKFFMDGADKEVGGIFALVFIWIPLFYSKYYSVLDI